MYGDVVRRLRKMIKAHKEIYGGSTEESVSIEQAADAIEELQQTVEHYKGCADDWYKEACEYKAMIPRWIPVTERLTETKIGEYVLVYEDGDIIMASYSGGEWYLRDMYEIIELKPTHWMPLPQPPKAET